MGEMERWMNAERQFAIWGWSFAVATALFDCVLVNDMFFTRPGQHGIMTTWKAAPWYLVALLGVPLAHIWLLALAWHALWGSRAIWRRARPLAVALLISIAVFHAIAWDNGAHVKRLISSNDSAEMPGTASSRAPTERDARNAVKEAKDDT